MAGKLGRPIDRRRQSRPFMRVVCGNLLWTVNEHLSARLPVQTVLWDVFRHRVFIRACWQDLFCTVGHMDVTCIVTTLKGLRNVVRDFWYNYQERGRSPSLGASTMPDYSTTDSKLLHFISHQ
jgi:hypothetical protein